MIINTKTNTIQTNVGNTTSATMKVCPTAFKILSSQIYSDKVSAVIREVSCNALDAHNAAGNPNPIRVHLPTRMTPEFIVEDDGTGIDPSLIKSLYLSYFESTKTDSNDDIGGFGLGCKSPLAYTDQFTVKNRLNGTETTYLIFFDTTHVPRIKEMGSSATDRPNGVTVSVPVRDSDIGEFAKKAYDVFRWWDIKPEFSGYEIEEPVIEYSDIDTDLFRVVKKTTSHANVGVLMGGVFYRVDPKDLHHDYPLTKFLLSENFIIYPFEIGELEVQASRESLSLDPYTVAALKKRAEQIDEYLRVGIQAKIDKCEHASTIYENLDSVEARLVKTHTEEFTFAGIPLNSPEYSRVFLFTDEQRKVASAGNVRHCVIWNSDLRMSLVSRVYKNVLTIKYLVLYIDKQTHAPAVRHHLAKSHRNKSFYTARTQEVVDMILEMLEGCDVTFHRLTDVLASGEVKIERSASTSYRGHLYKVWTADGEQDRKRASLADLYDMIDDNTYFEGYCFRECESHIGRSASLNYILEKGEKVVFVNESNLTKIIAKGGKRLRDDYKPSENQVRHIENIHRARRSKKSEMDFLWAMIGDYRIKEVLVEAVDFDGSELLLGDLFIHTAGIKSLQELHEEEKKKKKKTGTLKIPKDLVYLEQAARLLYPSVYSFIDAVSLKKEPQILLTDLIEFGKMVKNRGEM